ncbi:MAG TPA: carboxypeptidase-like regulatory domain-containing protein [Flavobacteriaceae bacterium]|nr:carboxypeptidase-like regulatory domain-containing protein [Flavobacteriaceae bacterium]
MIRILLLFFLIPATILAQDTERVTIEGRIIANDNDVENVTVFNASSNKGTITNINGEFTLEVALNDMLTLSALQFQQLKVTISQDVLNTKRLTVFLVERVNKLSEVVLLPYGLSGNIASDISSIETFNPDLDAIYFGVNDISSYEFPDDYQSSVENIAMNQGHIRYGLDIGAILGVVAVNIFGKNEAKNSQLQKIAETSKNKKLTDVYAHAFLSSALNIPQDKVTEFIGFIEREPFDYTLLNEGNEMKLLEFLVTKRKAFSTNNSDKN